MADKKSKPEKDEAVKADPLPQDLQPKVVENEEGTDWSQPISASNPPPSKRRLEEQHSPVTDGDRTLQKDSRKLDEELKKSEKEVAILTDSKEKRTRVTDADR